MSRRARPQLLPSLDVRTGAMPQAASSTSFPFASVLADTPDNRAASVMLTVAETAVRLNVSEKTVRRRIKDGTIRVARIGGRLLRISLEELARLAAGEPEKPP